MKKITVVYVKEAGVLGIITHRYPDGAARVFYCLDGISIETDLDEEEFELKAGTV